ncbi:hypothetical protein Pmani_032503 [Petrolisthes manimaculis]|uniref:Uncharacterized protein n=1 Tax=Petrolisthes manimaculis TaxID=1843537 RepID=A0AAE1TTQ6_9EUCA|nr:hypothetical protein Pmani_032503 [Petrolisthes manimaculis]
MLLWTKIAVVTLLVVVVTIVQTRENNEYVNEDKLDNQPPAFLPENVLKWMDGFIGLFNKPAGGGEVQVPKKAVQIPKKKPTRQHKPPPPPPRTRSHTTNTNNGIARGVGIGVASVLGAGAMIMATPFILTAAGFTGAGIAAGSLGASMMSSAAIANGGAVAAGTAVSSLQAAGVTGIGAATTAIVGMTGAVVGGKLTDVLTSDDDVREYDQEDIDFDSVKTSASGIVTRLVDI